MDQEVLLLLQVVVDQQMEVIVYLVQLLQLEEVKELNAHPLLVQELVMVVLVEDQQLVLLLDQEIHLP